MWRIDMVNLDKLKQKREEEAQKLKECNEKITERIEGDKIKEDIKKISAARLRAKLGVTKEKIVGKKKDAGKSLKKAGKIFDGLMKGLFAIGQSANEYYAQEQKRLRR